MTKKEILLKRILGWVLLAIGFILWIGYFIYMLIDGVSVPKSRTV